MPSLVFCIICSARPSAGGTAVNEPGRGPALRELTLPECMLGGRDLQYRAKPSTHSATVPSCDCRAGWGHTQDLTW